MLETLHCTISQAPPPVVGPRDKPRVHRRMTTEGCTGAAPEAAPPAFGYRRGR